MADEGQERPAPVPRPRRETPGTGTDVAPTVPRVKFIATFAEFLAATARERDPVSDMPRAWAVYNEAVYAQVQDMLHDPFVVAGRWQGGISEELAKGFLESIFGSEWVEERFAAADERERGWLRFAH